MTIDQSNERALAERPMTNTRRPYLAASKVQWDVIYRLPHHTSIAIREGKRVEVQVVKFSTLEKAYEQNSVFSRCGNCKTPKEELDDSECIRRVENEVEEFPDVSQTGSQLRGN
eukprot:IDg7701t1